MNIRCYIPERNRINVKMTNTCKCLVSAAHANLRSSTVSRRLEKIFENDGFLCDVSVVLDINSLPLDIDALLRCIHKLEINDYTELSVLLQDISLGKDNGCVMLEAFPMHYISENLHLDIVDTLKFNSTTGKITLQLTEKCYHSCPQIVSNNGVTVTRINSSRKGHGASHSVSFNYLISFSALNISAEIDYFIKTIFGNCQVRILTNREDAIAYFQGNETEMHSCTVILKELNMVQIPQASKFANQEDCNSIYEYLTLLHMNSPLLTERLDSYISSYEAPAFTSFANLDTNNRLHKYTLDYVDSNAWGSLISNNWLTISAYTNDSHVLILNDLVHQKLILWECN